MKVTQKRFLSLCSNYSIPIELSVSLHEDLINRYSEVSRQYHNLNHIDSMLCAYDRLSYKSDAIEFAIWFHDSVYDTHSKENEEKSAMYFRNQLSRYLDDEFVKQVENLILATRPNFKMSDDLEEAIMCDLDLSVLGSSPQGYEAYRISVRKEYGNIPDQVFYPARKEILEKLLMKPIYRTNDFHSLEKQARMNIENELLMMKGSNE